MSNTPNLDKLTPLARRSAQLTAQGLSDSQVRDNLALSISTWEAHREDVTWCAAVAELRAQDTAAQRPRDDTDESERRVDQTLNELSQS